MTLFDLFNLQHGSINAARLRHRPVARTPDVEMQTLRLRIRRK